MLTRPCRGQDSSKDNIGDDTRQTRDTAPPFTLPEPQGEPAPEIRSDEMEQLSLENSQKKDHGLVQNFSTCPYELLLVCPG
jgi:hypothetical protein